MAYLLRCDSCDLDSECPDWPEANRRASDHEAAYPDHWVTIHELQEA
ncbi:hypothetical protein RBH26_02630 [Natronolimnohabitans sp. A-GB9]|nr:hypothetical protein [Natronolimnohabitans sp. A-GB9]MDQ2049374.1 hypothetical protein [Natronolimnohabitans sp. A-GB9]